MVSPNEVGFGLLCNTPVLLQMLDFVGICCGKISDQASVVASDDDTTSSSRFLLVVPVANSETSLLVGVLKDFGVFIVTDTSEENYGVWLKQVL